MSDEHSPGPRTRKVREGLVVSDKMDKTVIVEVEDRVKHALYGKVLRRTRKLQVHDEQNACGIGDRVSVDGDPSAVRHQALARRGDPRKGQVSMPGRLPARPAPADHRSAKLLVRQACRRTGRHRRQQ